MQANEAKKVLKDRVGMDIDAMKSDFEHKDWKVWNFHVNAFIDDDEINDAIGVWYEIFNNAGLLRN